MAYVNPGDAFATGAQDYLLQDALIKRQALLDALHVKQVNSEIEQGQEALKEKRAEFAYTLQQKDRTDLEKQIANMKPGDVPDADLLERARRHGIAVPMNAATPAELPAKPVVPPTAGQPAAPGPVAGGAGMGPIRLTPPAPAKPETYAGDAKQREALAVKEATQKYIDTLPDGPEKEAAKYELATGKTAPAAAIKGPGTNTEAVFRQNAKKGTVERLVNGEWVEWKGDVPEHSHFMTEPQPKDTSAADAREAAHLDSIREKAVKNFDDLRKPLKSQMDVVDGLTTALAQNTNAADATIAPQVLKATVSGTGSGFRMTQPEIDQVLKGSRSGWDSLNLALNKWVESGGIDPVTGQPNPKIPLILTNDQRADIRKLARAIRKKAHAQYDQINDADEKVVHAKTVEEIDTIRTKLKRAIGGVDEPDEAPVVPPADQTPEAYLADYRKRHGGK